MLPLTSGPLDWSDIESSTNVGFLARKMAEGFQRINQIHRGMGSMCHTVETNRRRAAHKTVVEKTPVAKTVVMYYANYNYSTITVLCFSHSVSTHKKIFPNKLLLQDMNSLRGTYDPTFGYGIVNDYHGKTVDLNVPIKPKDCVRGVMKKMMETVIKRFILMPYSFYSSISTFRFYHARRFHSMTSKGPLTESCSRRSGSKLLCVFAYTPLHPTLPMQNTQQFVINWSLTCISTFVTSC